MNKFTGPATIETYKPKNTISTSRHFQQSSHTSSNQSGQTTTTTTRTTSHQTMTYSALPKPQEPPVNSAEYFQLLQQGNLNSTSSNIQQSATPPHIQGPAPGFNALRERFKSDSTAENTSQLQNFRREHQSNPGNSGLSSLRNQYITQAKELSETHEESFSQKIQTVSRTIGGQEQSQQQESSSHHVTFTEQQQPEEELQTQNQSVDEQAISSEDALADGGSSSGASPLENDANTLANTETST